MKKIILVPLSYCVNINYDRVLDSLSNLGVSEIQLSRHRQQLNTIFTAYQRGIVKDVDFRASLEKIFPTILNNSNIDTVWNSACVFNDRTVQIFNELEALQKTGVILYVFGKISPMHINFFKEKYGKHIPGIHFFSCDKLGEGDELIRELLNYINVQHPNIYQHDIALFYQPSPPISFFHRVINWFLSLFKFWQGATTEFSDEQKPYRSVPLPVFNQATLQETLQRELHWDFTLKSQARHRVTSDHTAERRSVIRKRRKPTDPSYDPLKDANDSTSDDSSDEAYHGYLPLSGSRRGAKTAPSPHETSRSSQTFRSAKRNRH